jgi:transketolase
MNKEKLKMLSVTAANIRKNALTAVYSAASGHPGGSLSATDILTVLYFDVMNVDAKNPKTQDRDRFVLSKGHCSPALYGTLAEK